MSRKRTQALGIMSSLGKSTAGLSLLLLWLTTLPAAPSQPQPAKSYVSALIEILAEVKEMGPYPGEDFIRRDFFVGDDDDDTNKDIHVMVLIRSSESKEVMTIRVTEMARDPGNPQASLAAASKTLSCRIAGDQVEIQSSDYEERDLEKLVPEILTAIRNKKGLLKLSLCGNGRPS